MATYEAFASEVEAAGLTPKDFGGGHWQIIGGVKPVNFYDTTKGRVFYVNGATKGVRGKNATLANAIRFAKEGVSPAPSGQRAKRRPLPKPKRAMLKANPHCMWCGKKLTKKTATVEHKVPLAQGGSNRRDNLGLACEPCNTARGPLALPPNVKRATR